MATLHEVLAQVRARIERSKSLHLNEQNTKASLIEPILRALGWDTEDFEEVHREFKPKSADNPVDYALFLVRSPRLFIEAKALGQDLNDRRWANQIMGYASVAGVEWIVLTDGDEYRIYNSHAAVPVEEKLFRRVHVSEGEDSPVEQTLSLLARDSIQKDEIGMLWQAYFVDWKVRTAIERLFAQNPDPAIVSLIAERVRNLSKDDITASLGRAHIRFDFPAVPDLIPLHVPKNDMILSTQREISPSSTKRWYGVSVTELIASGIVKPPMQLEHNRGEHRLIAQLEPDGRISWQGNVYPSLSAAGGAALTSIIGHNSKGGKRATDGWEFWCFRDADGSLKEIDVLRQRYLVMPK
ncbi:MAG: hypothetical protein ACR2JW_01125 [Thermomicrobiales bacterium]